MAATEHDRDASFSSNHLGRVSISSSQESPLKSNRGHHDADLTVKLSQLFGLPAEEFLLDDFICALRQSILFQGRLYVFEHYACFHSRIFNYEKKLTIPLKDVTQIRKKKHYGFGNAIEITWRGKRVFFTSLLKRDAAYKLLLFAWNKSSPYAKLFGGVKEGDPPSPHPHVTEIKKALANFKLPKFSSRGTMDGNRASSEGLAAGEDKSGQPPWESPETAPSVDTLASAEALVNASDSDSDSDTAGDDLEAWLPTTDQPPQPPEGMTLLATAELDLPVHDFYKEFMSGQSQFFITWHQGRGDTNVQLSEWRRHAMGHVRELSFVTPLKQRMGPSKCLCTQTQRIHLHPNNHLVFETSQIMDIPYGDHFSVQTRWDATPLDDNKRCKLEIRLAIPFSKKTIFRSTIEASTKQQMTEAAEDWVATAHRWLEPPLPAASAFSGALPDEEGDSLPAVTHLNRSQSLAMRMSADMIPDVELLLRAPTAHRSDIARMLQIQRLEADRRLSSRVSFKPGGSLPRGSASEGALLGASGRRLWLLVPAVLVAALLFLGALLGLRRVQSSMGLGLGWLPGWEGAAHLLRGSRKSDLAVLTARLEHLTASMVEMHGTLNAMHAQLKHCSPSV